MKIFNLILILSLMSCSGVLIGQNNYTEKIDDAIYSSQQEILPVIIIMKSNIRLDVQGYWSKEQKGTYTFETLSSSARVTQKPIIQILNDASLKYKSYYIVNGIATNLHIEMIESFAKRDDVAFVISNNEFRIDIPRVEINQGSRDATIEWGIKKVKADSVWMTGVKGENVVIGGADTGYDWDHLALKSTYRGWDGTNVDHNYNWFDAIFDPMDGSENNCGYSLEEPCDDFGHGTHTMGTMVGETEDNKIGVAPEAKWIGARNMDQGFGTPERYIACFEFFLAPTNISGEMPDPLKSPHVINNSWGCPPNEGCNLDNFNVMEMVVDNLKNAGIVVVVSAGNSGGNGCGSVSAPASIYENSFTIGATNSGDTLAGFSSRGPVMVDGSNRMKPNVSAPGVAVFSCTPNDQYATWNGTSMAGPHVAGAVALMISANPLIAGHVENIETILESTAVPLYFDGECGGFSGADIPNPFAGYGRIDALAAVEAAISWDIIDKVVEHNDKTINFYPSPVVDLLNIELIEEFNGTITVFTVSGQKVYEKITKNSNIIIDLSEMNSGIYFCVLRDDNNVKSFQFVKINQ